MTRFRKISRNVDFWPKMANFWPKRAKTAKTGFFGRNPKMSLPSYWEAPTLYQKSEQSYDRFSRSPPDERTDGRTNERMWFNRSQPLRGGPKRHSFTIFGSLIFSHIWKLLVLSSLPLPHLHLWTDILSSFSFTLFCEISWLTVMRTSYLQHTHMFYVFVAALGPENGLISVSKAFLQTNALMWIGYPHQAQ